MDHSLKSILSSCFLILLSGAMIAFVFHQTFKPVPFFDETQLSDAQKEAAGPSELYAEPEFTNQLPVAKDVVNPNAFVVPILMYHHVGIAPDPADKIRDDLSVPPDQFDQQVAWLHDHGYQSVTLNDLYLHANGKAVLPKKPIVFTFDDGYNDVFINAVPILKKYGYVGSFAIITQWPGTTKGSNTYATWNQIKDAMNQGMEIVSHTQNHFDGTNKTVTPEYILKDLSESRTDLKQHLGLETNLLIYPYGHYNTDYISAAQKAGFVMGVTVHSGTLIDPDKLMEIPRIRVHGHETLKTFTSLLLKMTQ